MRVIKTYKSGATYVSHEGIKINLGIPPVEVTDISMATKEEVQELFRSPKNKKLIDRIKARKP